MRKSIFSLCLISLALAHTSATRSQSSIIYALEFNGAQYITIPTSAPSPH